jgi:hypothetical protein
MIARGANALHCKTAALKALSRQGNVMTSQLNATTMSRPGHFLFRPWSHTDRRHVVTLVDGPFEAPESLEAARDACSEMKPQRCFLEPIDALDQAAVILGDKKREKHILKVGGDGLTEADLKFLAASWSPRSPNRLSIESRLTPLRWNAYKFAKTESIIRTDEPDRKFFVMELLDPVGATISP